MVTSARHRSPVLLSRLLLGGLLLAALSARADRVDQLSEVLAHDPSWRVRVQAVAVLEKLKVPRVVPALEQALSDANEMVRGLAAEALGRIGDPNARPALERARSDQSRYVRERALTSLQRLLPPSEAPVRRHDLVHVGIGGIGSKSRQAPPELTERLREFILHELARTPNVKIDGRPVTGFLIDSAITSLSRRTTSEWVEVSCEVSYVVGRLPSKAIVVMTSGGATVQSPKGSFRPEEERALEVDALKGAVEGAHQNLLAFLKTQH
jgi:hypothetical protein